MAKAFSDRTASCYERAYDYDQSEEGIEEKSVQGVSFPLFPQSVGANSPMGAHALGIGAALTA